MQQCQLLCSIVDFFCSSGNITALQLEQLQPVAAVHQQLVLSLQARLLGFECSSQGQLTRHLEEEEETRNSKQHAHRATCRDVGCVPVK
jgi:hypothetical protein